MMYRQGDVLLVKCAGLPPKVEKESNCVLAEGEVTGHKHQIHESAILWRGTRGRRYVEVTAPSATLVHEEHGPISLPGPAVYEVVRQREYTPGEVRTVAD